MLFRSFPLSGAVAADDAKDFARMNLEADVLERAEFLDLVAIYNLPPTAKVNRLRAKLRTSSPMTSRNAVWRL